VANWIRDYRGLFALAAAPAGAAPVEAKGA
jgi:hypothetical protein